MACSKKNQIELLGTLSKFHKKNLKYLGILIVRYIIFIENYSDCHFNLSTEKQKFLTG